MVTELVYRHLLGIVELAGDLDEWELKELGESLRDDLARQPWISVVDLVSPRRYEVSVNVSEVDLRRHKLSFDDVVRAIQSASLNLPAGAIKGDDGDIRVQTRGQAYYREDFEKIVLITARDGTQIYLGEVATIEDGFEDVDTISRFDGMPDHGLYAYVTTNPDVVKSSRVITEWVGAQTPNLPEGASLSFWRDAAVPFKDRVETLLKKRLGWIGVGLFGARTIFAAGSRRLGFCWYCSGFSRDVFFTAIYRSGLEHDLLVRLLTGARYCRGRCHYCRRNRFIPLSAGASIAVTLPYGACERWSSRFCSR